MAKHLLRRRPASEAPHQPFYKDERIIGKKITVNVSLRLFVGAIVLGALLFGFAMFKIIKDDNDLHNYLTHAHASRLADQARADQKVNQLACYIIASTPDNAAPIIPKVRAQYHCPPYGKDPNFKLYPKPVPSASTTSKPNPSAARPTASSQAGGAGVAQPHSSRSTSSSVGGVVVAGGGGSHPKPSSGPSAGAPKPVSTPTPVPGGSALVKLPVKLPPLASVGPIGVGGTCAVRVGNVCVAG